ncbi:hypothetical protein BH23VER1_BH23VER1_18730 [soil metagenome]
MIELKAPAAFGPGKKRGRKRKPKRSGAAREKRARRPRDEKRSLICSIIIGSVVVHLIALALFGIWVVSRNYKQPAATFEVTKRVTIPTQTPEHKMNMAAHEAMAPKPSFNDKLVSTRPTNFALPDLPKVDLDQMLPLDPSELVSDQVSSLVGAAGLGSGQGSGLGGSGGSGTSGMGFFGIEDAAASVVIMIDVSSSMFGRTGDYDYGTRKKLREGTEQSFQRVRDEAMKLIDGLDINARFNVMRWSGSAQLWRETLVPATDTNKAEAKAHIQEQVDVNTAGPIGGRPGGTRHDYALEALFKLNPEVAFMLSDGNATASQPGGGLQTIEEDVLLKMVADAKAASDTIPRIHTLYYLTGADKKDEERMLRGIARRSGGDFRKVKVDKR